MDVKELIYRPYIDGLRTIAVLIVLLFHLLPDIFPGGYLGVDIFFVISGFVISQSLYKDYLKNNRINIFRFYKRRILRLYPALFVMVSVTSILYFLYGFLWDTNFFIKSSLSSIFAFSNLYFIKHGNNYFDEGSINPLQHTWSLGLEEQFYLLYPIGLTLLIWIVTHKKNRERLIARTFLFLALILYSSFIIFSGKILGDYYWPTARFWELLVGCALFFYGAEYSYDKWRKLILLASIVLLFGTMLLKPMVDSIHTETLLVVLGSAGLIYSGLRGEFSFLRFLTLKPMLYFGALSYSIYLWHLPVIYFFRLYTSEFIYIFFSPIITLLFAALSYHLIETKFKEIQIPIKAWVMNKYILILGIIFLIPLGWFSVTHANATINNLTGSIKSVNHIEKNFNLGTRVEENYTLKGKEVMWTCDEANLSPTGEIIKNCLIKQNSKLLIYLVGDSHAVHLLPMLGEAELNADLYFQRHTTGVIVSDKIMTINDSFSILNTEKQLKEFSSQYEQIFLMSSFFMSPSEDHIEDIKRKLVEYIDLYKNVATLIFVAPTPVFKSAPALCVVSGVDCTLDIEADKLRIQKTFQMLQELDEKYENVYIYNPYTALCPNSVCKIYDQEKDFLLYRDDDHISVEGSISIAPHFRNWFIATFGK